MRNENVKNIIGTILISAIVLGIYAFYVMRELGKERARQQAEKEAERIRIHQAEQAAIAEREANTVTRKMIISHKMKYTEDMRKVYVGEIKNIYSKTITNVVFGFSNSNDERPFIYYNGVFHDSSHMLVNIPPNQTEFVQFPLRYNMSHLNTNRFEDDINKVMIVAVRFKDGSIEKGNGYKYIE